MRLSKRAISGAIAFEVLSPLPFLYLDIDSNDQSVVCHTVFADACALPLLNCYVHIPETK